MIEPIPGWRPNGRVAGQADLFGDLHGGLIEGVVVTFAMAMFALNISPNVAKAAHLRAKRQRVGVGRLQFDLGVERQGFTQGFENRREGLGFNPF